MAWFFSPANMLIAILFNPVLIQGHPIHAHHRRLKKQDPIPGVLLICVEAVCDPLSLSGSSILRRFEILNSRRKSFIYDWWMGGLTGPTSQPTQYRKAAFLARINSANSACNPMDCTPA